jgi:PAS domain-containing protein
MEDGLSARVRIVFRSIAIMIFMVTSAYLLLELVIALSAQGEPTGAVAPFTGAEVGFPIWYQAPEFLDATRFAMIAYPVAAVFYGIGLLAHLAGQTRLEEQPRMPATFPAPEAILAPDQAVVPAVEIIEELCVVSADRRIEHITPSTARLFGLRPQDMRGQSLESFIVPGDLPKIDALVAAAYADRPRAFATTVGILLADSAVASADITCTAGLAGGLASPGTTVFTIRPSSDRGRLDDQLAALWY